MYYVGILQADKNNIFYGKITSLYVKQTLITFPNLSYYTF